MKKKLIYITLILIFAISILTYLFISNPSKISECKVDADCIIIQTTCCPCNNAGQEICGTLEEKEIYDKEISQCSNLTICASAYNCEIENCICQEGKCVVQ